MCGIFGFVNFKAISGTGYDINLCKYFEQMLFVDQLRGVDGTGLMAYKKPNKVEILKTAGDFDDLCALSTYKQTVNNVDLSYAAVGHNRSATKGLKHSSDNAHPFVYDKVTLVHNGTLTYYPAEYRHEDKDKDVDSRALTEMFAKLGVVKAVKEFYGAFACVWFDETDKSINFARNSDRPLGFFRNKDGLFFASEISMAAWIASRNKIPLANASFEDFEYNHHYKLYLDDKNGELIKTKLELKKPTSVVSYNSYGRGGSYWNGYTDGYETDWPEDKDKSKEPATAKKSVEKEPDKELYKEYKIKGGKANKARFRQRRETLGKEFVIGDDIEFVLHNAKTTKTKFISFRGSCTQPIAEHMKHEIQGNISIPFEQASEFSKYTYKGIISNIYVSNTGFHQISVRDAELIIKEKEPNKQLRLVHNKSNQSCFCHGCHFSFAEGELVRISVKDTLEGNVPQTRAVNVCKDCYDSWKIDSSVFETFYRNAVSSVLFKTKGDFLSETSCSAL